MVYLKLFKLFHENILQVCPLFVLYSTTEILVKIQKIIVDHKMCANGNGLLARTSAQWVKLLVRRKLVCAVFSLLESITYKVCECDVAVCYSMGHTRDSPGTMSRWPQIIHQRIKYCILDTSPLPANICVLSVFWPTGIVCMSRKKYY